MSTINKLADKIVLELYGNDHLDFRTEVANHKMMLNKKTFKTIDNYGQVNFENLVINKLNNKYNGAQYES
jgi:hypothetical protein